MKALALILCLALLPIPTALAESPPPDDPDREPCAPTPVDVVFVVDTTGSMSGVLNNVKTSATNIMNNINTAWPGTEFGVGHYEDYPPVVGDPNSPTGYGASSDLPWYLDHTISSNTASVDASIQAIGQGSGADGPESLVRALHEVGQPGMGWRGGLQVVVLFTDAPGHDTNFGGHNFGDDPGPDGLLNTGDELDFEDVVDDLANKNIHVLAVQNGNWQAATDYLQHAASETDGFHTYFNSANPQDFEDFITDNILALNTQDAYAEAYDLYVGLVEPNIPASVLVDRLNLQQAPTDKSNSMVTSTHTVHVAGVGDYGFELDTLHAEASTQTPTGSSHAQARAHIAQFTLTDIGNNDELLKAEVLVAEATADAWQASAAAGADADTVRLSGSLLGGYYEFGSTHAIPLINGGSLIINEEITNVGTSEAWAEANAIHLFLPIAGGSTLEVIVSHAMAGAACAEAGTWDPEPPTDEPVAPECILDPSAESTAAGLPVVGGTLENVLTAWDGAEVHICPCPTDLGWLQEYVDEAGVVIGGIILPGTPDLCNPCGGAVDIEGTRLGDTWTTTPHASAEYSYSPAPSKGVDCNPCPPEIGRDIFTTRADRADYSDVVVGPGVRECSCPAVGDTAIAGLPDPCKPCIDPRSDMTSLDDCIECPTLDKVSGLPDPCKPCIDITGGAISTADLEDCIECPDLSGTALGSVIDPCKPCLDPSAITWSIEETLACIPCQQWSANFYEATTQTGTDLAIAACLPCDITATGNHDNAVGKAAVATAVDPCKPCIDLDGRAADSVGAGVDSRASISMCVCTPDPAPGDLLSGEALNFDEALTALSGDCLPPCDGGIVKATDVAGQAGLWLFVDPCTTCGNGSDFGGYAGNWQFNGNGLTTYCLALLEDRIAP